MVSTESRCFVSTQNDQRVVIVYFPSDPQHASPEDFLFRALQNQHPEYVHEASRAAFAALRRFKEAGLKDPFKIQGSLLVLNLVNTRPYRGYTSPTTEGAVIYVERTLRGEALRATVAHEIFHRVQYSYNETKTLDVPAPSERPPPFFTSMVREGGARAIETAFAPDAMRYENEAHEWFQQGRMSLATTRQGRSQVLGGASYQGALFWKYMAEQHGVALGGSAARPGSRELAVQRVVLECSVASGRSSPVMVTSLRAARRRMGGRADFDRFLYLRGDSEVPIWSETSWGNFQLALVLNGTAGSDRRFRFEDAARWRGFTAGRQAIPPRHQVDFTKLPSDRPFELVRERFNALASGPSLESGYGEFGPGLVFSERVEDFIVDARGAGLFGRTGALQQLSVDPQQVMLNAYSMLTFKVAMPQLRDTVLLQVDWVPLDGLTDGMVQIACLDQSGRLVEVYRHDGRQSTALSRIIPCRGLSEVIVIVASRQSPGNFRLCLREPADQPLLVIAGNDGLVGRQIGYDSNLFAQTWQSSDVRFYGIPGYWEIIVLVQNKGNQKAEDLEICCSIKPILGEEGWRKLTYVFSDGNEITTLETEDGCAELVRDSRGGDTLNLDPCYFDDGRGQQPWRSANKAHFKFIFDGPTINRHLVKIEYKDKKQKGDAQILYAINAQTEPNFVALI